MFISLTTIIIPKTDPPLKKHGWGQIMSFMRTSQLFQIRCIEELFTDYHETLTLGLI